ncbi:MAG: hypothetical protein LBR60_00840 [Fibrobacter sp.]|nr:hypothetical protein [Fibrobacter sp.]
MFLEKYFELKRIIISLFLLFSAFVFAGQISVWSLDEQLNSASLTTLRFKVENTSSQVIKNLEIHYHVTHDTTNLALPEFYYLPGGIAEWRFEAASKATLIIRFPGLSLTPLEMLGGDDGFSIGIHSKNWSFWNKTDDFSSPESSHFEEVNNIDVYSNGVLLTENHNTKSCPDIWFTEVQKDSIKMAWKAQDDTNIETSVQLHGFQGLLETIDLTSSIDSADFKLWQGSAAIQHQNQGEIWVTCQGVMKAYFAYGWTPTFSEQAVQFELWDSQGLYVVANTDLGYNQGLLNGDRLIVRENSRGRNIEDWEYYRPWEEPGGVPMPTIMFPGLGTKILPETASDSITFSWTAVENVPAYQFYIVRDSAYGDTVFSLITPETSLRLPMLATGNYVWWAEPVELRRGLWSWAKKTVKKAVTYTNPISYYIFNDVSATDAVIQHFTHPIGILSVLAGDVVARERVLNVPSLPARKDSRMLDLGYKEKINDGVNWDFPHIEFNPDWNVKSKQHSRDNSEHNRCWAVMAQMLNRYYGGNLTQDEIIYEVKEVKYDFPRDDALSGNILERVNAVSFALNIGALDGVAYSALSALLYSGAFSYTQLTAALGWHGGPPDPISIIVAIESGMPLGISQANQGFDGGHSMVVDGYKITLDGSIYLHFLNIDNEGNSEWRYYASVHGVGIDVILSTIATGIKNGLNWAFDLDMGGVLYKSYFIPPVYASGRMSDSRLYLDSDVDGITDFDEQMRFFTDPYNADTDGDGASDKDEIRYYTLRKLLADEDNDGLRAELDVDSDGDGYCDGDEYSENTDSKIMLEVQNHPSNMEPRCVAHPVALLAREKLFINDRAYCDDGINPCPVISLGKDNDYAVNLGVSAWVGDITVRGNVWLRSHSQVHGDLHLGGTLNNQGGTALVAGTIYRASREALVAPGVYQSVFTKNYMPLVDFKLFSSLTVNSNKTYNLPPNAYLNKVIVSSGATLRLMPGTYNWGELIVEAGGVLELPESGTVTIKIKDHFQWNGTFGNTSLLNVAGRLIVHTDAAETVFLNSSFAGQLIAPKALVILGQGDKLYAGQIAARSITIHQNTRFIWVKEGANAVSPVVAWNVR